MMLRSSLIAALLEVSWPTKLFQFSNTTTAIHGLNFHNSGFAATFCNGGFAATFYNGGFVATFYNGGFVA